jgi:general stress protein 26
MKKEEAIAHSLTLANRSKIALLATNGAEGYPNIKAMIKNKNEGLRRIWFTTNTSSKKIAQLKMDAKACVYFVDFDKWMGLMLVGTIDVLQDPEAKQQFWHDGFERYYPLGVNDPDYSVLCFRSLWGNYYHNLVNTNFEL